MKTLLIGLALMLGALTAYAESADIKAFEPDSMEHIVQSRKGKPFVLIVWSLDCEYCKASLDALAREKRRNGKLNVVTLATDTLADPEAAAMMKKRLQATGMHGSAWAFGSAPPEQLRYAIDPKWHGEMPRSYWFDGRGERKAYSGVITPATFAKLGVR